MRQIIVPVICIFLLAALLIMGKFAEEKETKDESNCTARYTINMKDYENENNSIEIVIAGNNEIKVNLVIGSEEFIEIKSCT